MDKNAERYKVISRNIKKYRKIKNMTQKELSEKVGISLSYLTKIEAEKCNKTFSLDVLFDIADVLDIDIKKFFWMTGDK